MERILRIVCLLAFFCLLSVSGAEATREIKYPPLRVAQFPVQLQGRMMPSKNVQDKLGNMVDRSLHVPLNDTLEIVEFIPEKECLLVLSAVQEEAAAKTSLKDMMRPVADELKADLVVMPILNGYEQYQTMSWHRWGRHIIHSYASVQVLGYDKQKDEVFCKTAYRQFNDEYSSQGDVSTLAYEAMDEALRKAGIHDRVWERKLMKVGYGSARLVPNH